MDVVAPFGIDGGNGTFTLSFPILQTLEEVNLLRVDVLWASGRPESLVRNVLSHSKMYVRGFRNQDPRGWRPGCNP